MCFVPDGAARISVACNAGSSVTLSMTNSTSINSSATGFMATRIAILPALLVLLVSCGDDPAGPEMVASIKAKPGNIYRYHTYDTDSSGVAITPARDTSISTVLRTNATYLGKPDVIVVEDSSASGADTLYLGYESNDNVSIVPGLDELGLAPRWLTLPVASAGPLTVTSRDTLGAGTDTVEITDAALTATALGSEYMTVKGETIFVQKIRVTMEFSRTVNVNGASEVDVDLNYSYYLYYAPALGFIAKTTTPALYDSSTGQWMPGTTVTLYDFELK
jgi:hypothetical protein